MKSDTTKTNLAMVAAMALVTAGSSSALTAIFSPTRAASGVSWGPNYSVPVNEGGTLAIGALDNAGTPFLTAALLGYDVSSLAGQYASIESVTLTGAVRDQYPGGGAGTVDLFRVADSHAAWTNSATWAQDGTGNPWPDGATMGTVETGAALASTTVTRGAAVGTIYTWTITGPDAQALIEGWISGANPGLALADGGTGGGVDYRCNIGGIQGSVPQPTLTINFTPVYVSASLVWKGAAAANPSYWDIESTANWSGGPSGMFRNGDRVLFDDSAASFSVDLQSLVLPESVTVDNTTAYSIFSSINGAIDGFGGLVKNGSGLLTITTPNNFSGSVAINNGTVSVPSIANSLTPLGQGTSLSLGDATHSGTLQFTGTSAATSRSITVADAGGVLDVTTAGENLVLGGVISGTGGLTKTGDGTLVLTANNTFSGGTTVTGGTLSLSNSNGAFNTSQLVGTLTINPGATLAVAGFPFGYGGGLTDLNVNGGTVTGTGSLGSFGLRYNLTGGSIAITSRLDLGARDGIDGAINSLASSATSVVSASAGLMMRGDSAQKTYIFAVAPGTTASGVDLQIAAAITENAGPCAIVKAGTGTMEMTAANSYTGDTSVEAGILLVNGNSIADANKLVLSGGKLAIAADADETVNSLYFGSTQQAAGTYGSSSSPATFADDTRFAGSGMLTVTTGALSNDYDTWLGGFTFASGADTTPAGDPDGDGLSNRQEYAFGLNPTNGASVAPITVPLDKTSGSFTYTRRNPSLSNLAFKVWTSPDLSEWSEDTAAIQTPLDAGDEQSVTVVISAAKPLTASAFFIRVTAE